MATLLPSSTGGNFTSSTSWALVDATSYLDSEAATVGLSTSNTDSQTFTPGAITVDGVALKLASRASSPSGTITVTLRNSSAGSDVISVSGNVSTLPSAGNGWVLFKFSSPQLLLAATNYLIRAVTSVNSQVTVYRDGTAANMSRLLRTTTNQAPAANDQLVICGEILGTGSINAISITMDNTATTSFGPTVSGGPPQGVVVSLNGTLTWDTSGGVNLYFKWKGVMLVAGGGTLNVGTSGARIDSTSTAILECDSVANVDTGIQVTGGAFTVYGPVQTNLWTLLTADAAVGASTLTVASTAGWAAGDILALPSTTRTYSQCEEVTILTVDSATQVTLTGVTTYAHGGDSTTGVQGEVLNLTQAVKIRGVGSSLNGYVYCNSGAAVHVEQCEFTRMGSGTSNKRGISLAGGCTSAVFTYVTSHDSTGLSQQGFDISTVAASSSAWLSLTHVVTYNIQAQHLYLPVSTVAGTGAVFTDMVMALNATEAIFYYLLPSADNLLFTDIRVACASGASSGAGVRLYAAWARFNGLVVHSCGDTGILVQQNNLNLVFNGAMSVWRNSNNGMVIENEYGVYSSTSYTTPIFQIGGPAKFFGNSSAGIYCIRGFAAFCAAQIVDCEFDGGSTLVQDWGIYFGGVGSAYSAPNGVLMHGGGFAQNSALGVGSIRLTSQPQQVVCDGTLFGVAPSASTGGAGGYVRCQGYGAGNDNRTYFWQGVDQTDTTIYRTAAPSERMTPNASSATNKLQSGDKAIPVGTGQAATVTVYVRTSVSGDGAAYNGAAPRLMLRWNDAAGVTSDTVLATLSGGSGSFAALSGVTPTVTEDTTLRVYVDCDGNVGWVNVDDWSVVVA